MTGVAGGALDAAVRRHAGPAASVVGLAVAALVAAGVVWAAVVEIDEIVTATGEVVPTARVQIVQHLEGGLVRTLRVAEGDVVERGAPLVELTLPMLAMDRDELAARHGGLRLAAARLEAERSGEVLTLPSLAGAYPELVRAERATHASRREERAARRLELDARVRERALAVAELQARQASIIAEQALAGRTLAMTRDLVRDNLVSELEHLQAQRDVERLDGELRTLERAVLRSEAAVVAAREHRTAALAGERRATVEALRETRLELARVEELLRDASEQRERAVVRSPLTGTVKAIRHHTIGAVVRPGEPLMEIVPAAGGLRIEARLAAGDRGAVRVGQAARLKITAYDFLRHGTLDATVSGISPDTLLDAEGLPYYALTLTPSRAGLDAAETLPLRAGMQSVVEILVDRRTVLEALIRPLRIVGAEALRERD